MPRKRLLLIGGGHSHLFVLESLRVRAHELRDRIDVTLVSRDLRTPYSGMLPGLIAGHYRPSECHIDLAPLAEAANVTLVHAAVNQLDLIRNVAIGNGQEWPFDIVSIDIGSNPPLTVPGASSYALSVKPIDVFLESWNELLQNVGGIRAPVHVVTVGGGAGGVEVALAMAYRLRSHRDCVKLSLVTRDQLLPGYPRRAARLLASRLEQAGVALQTHTSVAQADEGRLHFADGSSAACDALIWATGAAPQAWVAASGLDCVENGFISVNAHLQSTSHPQVFAAGDIATNVKHRRPKAGVFAVRQGPVLAENLLRFVSGKALGVYRPQRDYLSLLSTGGQHAIACWYGLVWQGDRVWRWKDRIDRKFMTRFSAPFS